MPSLEKRRGLGPGWLGHRGGSEALSSPQVFELPWERMKKAMRERMLLKGAEAHFPSVNEGTWRLEAEARPQSSHDEKTMRKRVLLKEAEAYTS